MNPWLCNLLFNNSGGSSLPATGQTFYASLKTSMVPEVGIGGPTWSRATEAWRFNELGYLRKIPSGCAEFGGARLVRNLCTGNSDNFSGATLGRCSIVSAAVANHRGTNTAVKYLLDNTAGPHYARIPSSAYAGMRISVSVVVKRDEYQYISVRSGQDTTPETFNLTTNTWINVAQAETIARSFEVIDATWIRLTVASTVSTGTKNFGVGCSSSLGLDRWTPSGTENFTIADFSICDVTGRDASYVPEYVSVGSDTNKNFFTYTDDFSQPAWSRTNVTITQAATANPINGLVNAQKVEASSSATTSLSYISGAVGRVGGNIFVVYVKQGSEASDANSFLIRNYTSSTNLVSITLNYSTGNITYLTGSTGASAVDVGGGWWRVTLIVTSGISANDQLRPYIGFVGGSETINEFCYVYRPYLGCGITAPDVIPVVAGSWDAHGSGVDGCKYFATDWQGAPIPITNLTRLRKESSATNALLWSRDLSNAAWSTKTNITAAKTATGLDGIANSASTLTATSADAIILQPTSGIASAARCASAHVERVAGTGAISFTQDGGSTWTDITPNINSATYSRVQITATLANPSVGFKISTSGDAIAVDCVQNEAGSVATSPIVTTTATVTRNADALTYQTAGNINFSVGSSYAMFKSSITSIPRYAFHTQYTAGSLISTAYELTSWRVYDGTSFVTATGLDDFTVSMVKRAVAWGESELKVCGKGLSPTVGAFDGTMGSGAIIDIGSSLDGYIGDVAFYNYKMTDAELQAITT